MFWRSLLLQCLWNYQRMQNTGWLFALWPALRRLYAEPKTRREAAVAHLEYFNTHPYFSGIILGVVAGLEEEQASQPDRPRGRIHAAKQFMSGPLAALGDSVFWAGLRPVLALVGVVVAMNSGPEWWWMGPAIFLALYNSAHLTIRAGGLVAGYRLRSGAVTLLSRFHPERLNVILIGVALAAVLGGLADLLWQAGDARWAAGALAAGVFAGRRFGLPPTRLFVMTVVVAWILRYTGAI